MWIALNLDLWRTLCTHTVYARELRVCVSWTHPPVKLGPKTYYYPFTDFNLNQKSVSVREEKEPGSCLSPKRPKALHAFHKHCLVLKLTSSAGGIV